MALYSVRSERQFCEQLSYNLLFRWFLGMDMVEPTFDATTFTKNRERLLAHAAGEFFRDLVEQARKAHLMSSEHFTVDGTLIDAWASLESFKKKDAQDDDSRRPTTQATRRSTSTARGEATIRTLRRRIQKRSSPARGAARRPRCRSRRTR